MGKMSANKARKTKVYEDNALANGLAWSNVHHTAHRANVLRALQQKTSEHSFERALLDLLLALDRQALEKVQFTEVPPGSEEGKRFFEEVMSKALGETEQCLHPVSVGNRSHRHQVKKYARNTAIGIVIGFVLGLALGLSLFMSR